MRQCGGDGNLRGRSEAMERAGSHAVCESDRHAEGDDTGYMAAGAKMKGETSMRDEVDGGPRRLCVRG